MQNAASVILDVSVRIAKSIPFLQNAVIGATIRILTRPVTVILDSVEVIVNRNVSWSNDARVLILR